MADLTFGALLKQLRRRAGMTQGELAAQVSLSVAQVSRLEANARLPDLTAVIKHFLPALGLQEEPRLARRLIELAAAARGERPPAAVTFTHSSHYVVETGEEQSEGLPLPPTPVIGREQEIDQLCARLMDPHTRLLTLLGPPGIGKTTLGLAVAHRLQPLFAHGATFVPLAAVADPEHVVPAVLAALAVPETGGSGKTPQLQLIELLRRKELLLVLDNFEQVTPAGRAVADLLAACPGLRILVTSREPLRLRAERRFRVQPLETAPTVALFTERAQAVEPDFALTPTNAATVAQICRRLDCLPLAIELVAARLPGLALGQLLAQVQERSLDLAGDAVVDLPDHQRTLRATLARSYALLSAAEQRVFRLLGVFAGGCDPAALAAVAPPQHPSLPRLPLAEVVTALVNKSLVRTAESGEGAPRILMLETLRDYALELLDQEQELAAARTAHAGYYHTWAATQVEHPPETAAHPLWLRLEQEHDNLRAALRWWLDQEPARAVRLAVQLAPFWQARGRQQEARRWLNQALARAPAPTATRARGLLCAGIFAQQMSDFAAARPLLDETLAIFRTLDDPAGVAETLRAAGWVALDSHARPRALQLFAESLAVFRQLGDQAMTATVLADLAHSLGSGAAEQTQARAFAQESLAIFRSLGRPAGIAYALQQVGLTATWAGNYAQARAAHTESLAILRQLQATRDIAWALGLLGEAAWHAGDLDAAQTHWEEAHALFAHLESRHGLMLVTHHLGQVARRRGELAIAAQHYRRSLELSRALDDATMLARSLAGLGGVALAQTRPETAAALLAAAFHLFETLPPFLAPADRAEYAEMLAAAQAGAAPVALTPEQAAALALDAAAWQ